MIYQSSTASKRNSSVKEDWSILGRRWQFDVSLVWSKFGWAAANMQCKLLQFYLEIITLIIILCEKKALERDFTSVSLFLSTTLKSALAALSYVCRWASCRGVLPQPIAVLCWRHLPPSVQSAPRRKIHDCCIGTYCNQNTCRGFTWIRSRQRRQCIDQSQHHRSPRSTVEED